LNPDHPRGKAKARVFASLLGITRDGANELAALVRQAATDGDIPKAEVTIFGRYYRVDWAIPARGNSDYGLCGKLHREKSFHA